MSISNEALRKVLVEIEQKSIQSSQQISIVKAQLTAKTRESRKLQLTAKEVEELPTGTRTYEGVGKMFLHTPRAAIVTRLEKEDKQVKEEINGLEKKLHYYETTHKNTREHIEALLKAGGVA